MTNQLLTESIRTLEPRKLNWELLIYNSAKGRDGVSFMFGKCEMENIGTWVTTVLEAILDTNLQKQTVAKYSSFLPREEIGAVAAESPLMNEPLSEALNGAKSALPYNPEDFLSGMFPKISGYAFHATDENGKDILLMRRANPFVFGNRMLGCICGEDDGVIKESRTPILKFSAKADFLLLDNVCYFFSGAAQRDFALEDRAAALCAQALSLIGECDMVSDFARLEEAAKKQSRKFEDFSEELMENIGRMSLQARDEYVSTYGVSVGADGRILTNTAEEAGLLIDFLCSRSCLDIYGRLAVGSKIVPRE
ncbi:MAG: hypothetical protein FWG82_06615 [Oscillospiraceae bacterium]|nr:hypothetical protein [Oscillospiraceae bacterium]